MIVEKGVPQRFTFSAVVAKEVYVYKSVLDFTYKGKTQLTSSTQEYKLRYNAGDIFSNDLDWAVPNLIVYGDFKITFNMYGHEEEENAIDHYEDEEDDHTNFLKESFLPHKSGHEDYLLYCAEVSLTISDPKDKKKK